MPILTVVLMLIWQASDNWPSTYQKVCIIAVHSSAPSYEMTVSRKASLRFTQDLCMFHILCPHGNPLSLYPILRYFVLDAEQGQLHYFVSEPSKSQKPRGSLPLPGASVVPHDELPHMFCIYAANGEIFKLRGTGGGEVMRLRWGCLLDSSVGSFIPLFLFCCSVRLHPASFTNLCSSRFHLLTVTSWVYLPHARCHRLTDASFPKVFVLILVSPTVLVASAAIDL